MDRVPIEQLKSEKPGEVEAEEIRSNSTQDLQGIHENIEYHRVADFLGIDYAERQDPQLAERIEFIYKWGQETAGTEDRLEALIAVKNLIKSMGITDKGQEMIKKVYKWMRLDTTRKRIEKEMTLLT